jgi:hypothetical protein
LLSAAEEAFTEQIFLFCAITKVISLIYWKKRGSIFLLVYAFVKRGERETSVAIVKHASNIDK